MDFHGYLIMQYSEQIQMIFLLENYVEIESKI